MTGLLAGEDGIAPKGSNTLFGILSFVGWDENDIDSISLPKTHSAAPCRKKHEQHSSKGITNAMGRCWHKRILKIWKVFFISTDYYCISLRFSRAKTSEEAFQPQHKCTIENTGLVRAIWKEYRQVLGTTRKTYAEYYMRNATWNSFEVASARRCMVRASGYWIGIYHNKPVTAEDSDDATYKNCS